VVILPFASGASAQHDYPGSHLSHYGPRLIAHQTILSRFLHFKSQKEAEICVNPLQKGESQMTVVHFGTTTEEIIKAVGCTEQDLRTLALKDFNVTDLHILLEQAE
jgi:hypothetical protein